MKWRAVDLQVTLERGRGLLGRARHERTGDRVGYRNGYEPLPGGYAGGVRAAA